MSEPMGNIHANQQLPEDQVMANANGNETIQLNQLANEHQAVANANGNELEDDEDDAWDPQELDDDSHVELDNDTDADVISMADSDILHREDGFGSTRGGVEYTDNSDANSNANNNTTVESNVRSNSNSVYTTMEEPIWYIPWFVCLPSEDTKYSDWQIDIRFHDSMDVTSYLVHRYRLGPQSSYFKMIFRDEKAFLESNTKRSFIEFPEDAPVDIHKKDFELFLNCLYTNDGDDNYFENEVLKDCGRSDVLSMFYLADYFGVDRLSYEVIFKIERFSSKDEVWAAKAYCFAESLALKDMKVKIQKLCYIPSEFKHCGIWSAIPDQGLKRNLLKGIQKLWRKDLNDGNVDESKAKRWYSIVGGVLQSNPDLVDSCLLLEIQVDLARDRDRFGIGRLLKVRHALAYLKRERELGLDAQEMDGLTTFQDEFVQSFASKKPDVIELPDIIEALQDLKPSITKNLLCFCLQNNN